MRQTSRQNEGNAVIPVVKPCVLPKARVMAGARLYSDGEKRGKVKKGTK